MLIIRVTCPENALTAEGPPSSSTVVVTALIDAACFRKKQHDVGRVRTRVAPSRPGSDDPVPGQPTTELGD